MHDKVACDDCGLLTLNSAADTTVVYRPLVSQLTGSMVSIETMPENKKLRVHAKKDYFAPKQ